MSEATAAAPAAVPATTPPAPAPEASATPPAPAVEGQAPVVATESAATPPPAPPAPEAKDERFEQLARREADVVHRAQQAKQLRAEAEALTAQAQELASLKDLAKTKPVDLFQKLGLTVEQVKAQIAQLESNDPAAQALRTVEEFKREQAQRDAAAKADAEQKQADAVRAQHRRDVSDFIGQQAEKYELVAAYGKTGIDLVQQKIIDHLQKTHDQGLTPELLSFEQAAQMVEDMLEKQYVEPALKTKKITSRLKPAEASAPAATPPAQTLTNALVAAKTVQDADEGPTDPDERLAWVLRKYGG